MISVIGGSGFTNTGTAAYGGLAAGQSANAETVSLSTTATGTFSETLVFHSTGSNAGGYSGALADQKVVVTGTVTTAAPSGRLAADLTLPATTTVGQTGTGVVTYSHAGTLPLPAQILEISSTTAGVKLAGATTYSNAAPRASRMRW